MFYTFETIIMFVVLYKLFNMVFALQVAWRRKHIDLIKIEICYIHQNGLAFRQHEFPWTIHRIFVSMRIIRRANNSSHFTPIISPANEAQIYSLHILVAVVFTCISTM